MVVSCGPSGGFIYQQLDLKKETLKGMMSCELLESLSQQELNHT